MVWKTYLNNVKFCALAVSILVHVLIFLLFTLVQSNSPDAKASLDSIGKQPVEQVRKALDTAYVISKPKFRKVSNSQAAAVESAPLVVGKVFDFDSDFSGDYDLLMPEQNQVYSLPENQLLPSEVEMFSSNTQARKVCYVVDCSGSMQGVFERVREELRDSISSLQPDQYFYVIFFGNDKLYEFGGGFLVRASSVTKNKALRFVDRVKPAGCTNALEALCRALEITDKKHTPPQVIYLLTDGFELDSQNNGQLDRRIESLLRDVSIRINTIAFWPREANQKMLERIARATGGEFVSVDNR